MTQADLARASQLNESTVSMLLSGERRGGRRDTQVSLAQAFRMSHADFVAAVRAGRPPKPSTNGSVPDVETAIRRDPDLTHDQQEALLTVYRSYRRR